MYQGLGRGSRVLLDKEIHGKWDFKGEGDVFLLGSSGEEMHRSGRVLPDSLSGVADAVVACTPASNCWRLLLTLAKKAELPVLFFSLPAGSRSFLW